MNVTHSEMSLWTKLSIGSAVVLISGLLAATSPLMLILTPVCLVPPGILYFYWDTATRQSSTRVPASSLTYTFLLSGTIGVLIVVVIQGILSYLLAYLCLRRDTSLYLEEFGRTEADLIAATNDALIIKRAELASRWKYWAFMVLFAYLVPALTEELLKYTALPFARKYLLPATTVMSSSTIIPIIAASALGFSTFENIGFLYGAAVTAKEPTSTLLLTTVERVFLSGPGHVLTALLIGINIVSHFKSLGEPVNFHVLSFGDILGLIALPVFFHGTFDLVLFATSASYGNVGWVHPRQGVMMWLMYVYCLATWGSLAVVVAKRWSKYNIEL